MNCSLDHQRKKRVKLEMGIPRFDAGFKVPFNSCHRGTTMLLFAMFSSSPGLIPPCV